MDDQCEPKKVLTAKVYNTRKSGRPRLREESDVLEGQRRVKMRGYAEMTSDSVGAGGQG